MEQLIQQAYSRPGMTNNLTILFSQVKKEAIERKMKPPKRSEIKSFLEKQLSVQLNKRPFLYKSHETVIPEYANQIWESDLTDVSQ